MMSDIIITGDITEPEFDEDGHVYMVDGRPVPSVTQVMRPLTQQAYASSPAETLRLAAERGTAVHACTEYDDAGELDEASVEDGWRPYLEAYRKWRADVKPQIDAAELRLGCKKYCGTIDRLCTINGESWVIDLKTTSEIHPHVGVQLAAYEALAAAKFGKHFRRGALQLRSDGTYRFTEFVSYLDAVCFAGLLSINYWEAKNDY